MVQCRRALIVLLLAQVAHAQNAPTPLDDPDTERARVLYQEGAQLYAARKYQEAIVKFEQARALKAAPGLDYNIARAYDRLGNDAKAVEAYRRYVASGPSDADVVRARIAVLEQRLPKPAQAQAQAQAPPPAPPPPARKKRTWVYVVAGVAAAAVVGVVVGVVLGLGTQPSYPMAPLGAVHW
jgi:tetratricopeptide (TPR) repeat protein